MKTKIKEILNEYLEEYQKYYRKIRKKYRKLRYTIINSDTYLKLEPYLINIKNNIVNKEYRKRNIAILSVGVLIGIAFLIFIPTYGFYQNNFDFNLLGSTVGDFNNNNADYSLNVYIEEINSSGTGSGNYELAEEIPHSGYVYSGYSCKNGSTLIYDEISKTTSVTAYQKDVCSIYFDLDTTMDIIVKVMLEDAYLSDTYHVSKNIPVSGYTYSHYECNNNGILTYDSTLHKASVSTTSTDYCTMYFKKDAVDIEVELYVEDSYGSKNYINRDNIPANKIYTLNDTSSECLDSLGNIVSTDISYTDGYINIDTTDVSVCKVYLDVANE